MAKSTISPRELFDLSSNLAYLNSGTHSICPREVLEAVTRYQREYELNPTLSLINAYPTLWRVQRELAGFLGADPLELFFRANVTEAMNAFIMGMPLRPGSEILVSDLEYGAIVNACRYRASRDGLTVREFHVPLDADRAGLSQTVVSAISARTALVVLSHVTTGTGHVFPIEEIGAETRRRNVLLAVDGAHGPGALALDFSKLGDLDFYGGNLHKWMLGPKGTGFGWAPRRHHDKLAALEAGWPTFARPDFYGSFDGASPEATRFTERLQFLGCHDFAPFFAIHELLAFWKRLGPENIRARIFELRAAAEAELSKLGWPKLSSDDRALQSPLLSYELPTRLVSPTLMTTFAEKGIQLSATNVQGRWAVRISPHIYNTVAEIRGAAEMLRAL